MAIVSRPPRWHGLALCFVGGAVAVLSCHMHSLQSALSFWSAMEGVVSHEDVITGAV
jgi:hypothetical protein